MAKDERLQNASTALRVKLRDLRGPTPKGLSRKNPNRGFSKGFADSFAFRLGVSRRGVLYRDWEGGSS